MFRHILAQALLPSNAEYKDKALSKDPSTVEQDTWKKGNKSFKEMKSREDKYTDHGSPVLYQSEWKSEVPDEYSFNEPELHKIEEPGEGKFSMLLTAALEQVAEQGLDRENTEYKRSPWFFQMLNVYLQVKNSPEMTPERLKNIFSEDLIQEFEDFLLENPSYKRKESSAFFSDVLDVSDKALLFVLRSGGNDSIGIIKNGAFVAFETVPTIGEDWKENINWSVWSTIFDRHK